MSSPNRKNRPKSRTNLPSLKSLPKPFIYDDSPQTKRSYSMPYISSRSSLRSSHKSSRHTSSRHTSSRGLHHNDILQIETPNKTQDQIPLSRTSTSPLPLNRLILDTTNQKEGGISFSLSNWRFISNEVIDDTFENVNVHRAVLLLRNAKRNLFLTKQNKLSTGTYTESLNLSKILHGFTKRVLPSPSPSATSVAESGIISNIHKGLPDLPPRSPLKIHYLNENLEKASFIEKDVNVGRCSNFSTNLSEYLPSNKFTKLKNRIIPSDDFYHREDLVWSIGTYRKESQITTSSLPVSKVLKINTQMDSTNISQSFSPKMSKIEISDHPVLSDLEKIINKIHKIIAPIISRLKSSWEINKLFGKESGQLSPLVNFFIYEKLSIFTIFPPMVTSSCIYEYTTDFNYIEACYSIFSLLFDKLHVLFKKNHSPLEFLFEENPHLLNWFKSQKSNFTQHFTQVNSTCFKNVCGKLNVQSAFSDFKAQSISTNSIFTEIFISTWCLSVCFHRIATVISAVGASELNEGGEGDSFYNIFMRNLSEGSNCNKISKFIPMLLNGAIALTRVLIDDFAEGFVQKWIVPPKTVCPEYYVDLTVFKEVAENMENTVSFDIPEKTADDQNNNNFCPVLQVHILPVLLFNMGVLSLLVNSLKSSTISINSIITIYTSIHWKIPAIVYWLRLLVQSHSRKNSRNSLRIFHDFYRLLLTEKYKTNIVLPKRLEEPDLQKLLNDLRLKSFRHNILKSGRALFSATNMAMCLTSSQSSLTNVMDSGTVSPKTSGVLSPSARESGNPQTTSLTNVIDSGTVSPKTSRVMSPSAKESRSPQNSIKLPRNITSKKSVTSSPSVSPKNSSEYVNFIKDFNWEYISIWNEFSNSPDLLLFEKSLEGVTLGTDGEPPVNSPISTLSNSALSPVSSTSGEDLSNSPANRLSPLTYTSIISRLFLYTDLFKGHIQYIPQHPAVSETNKSFVSKMSFRNSTNRSSIKKQSITATSQHHVPEAKLPSFLDFFEIANEESDGNNNNTNTFSPLFLKRHSDCFRKVDQINFNLLVVNLRQYFPKIFNINLEDLFKFLFQNYKKFEIFRVPPNMPIFSRDYVYFILYGKVNVLKFSSERSLLTVKYTETPLTDFANDKFNVNERSCGPESNVFSFRETKHLPFVPFEEVLVNSDEDYVQKRIAEWTGTTHLDKKLSELSSSSIFGGNLRNVLTTGDLILPYEFNKQWGFGKFYVTDNTMSEGTNVELLGMESEVFLKLVQLSR